MREQFCQKCLEKWWNWAQLIRHDNRLVQTALSVQQMLAAKNIAMIPYPSYSPDFAP